MPWRSSDSLKHTKQARGSKKAQRAWAHVANSMLKRGASEGAAVRAANAAVKKRGRKRRSSRS